MNQILMSIAVLLILSVGSTPSFCKINDRLFDHHQRNALWVLAGGRCMKCRVKLLPYKGNDRSAEADHVLAYSKGGSTSLDNGQMLCRLCNRKKGSE